MEDLVDDYKILYMINGNTEQNIDYLVLLDTYLSYLSLFISEDNRYKDFYHNIFFINSVINGFFYYQKSIFESEYVDDITLSQYIFSKYNEIEEKAIIRICNSSCDSDNSISDQIFKVSILCKDILTNVKPELASQTIIKQLFTNSCNIENTLDKYNGNYKGM